MYTPSWLSDQSLSDSLQQQPWRWQIGQASRVINITGGTFRAVSDPVYGYPFAEVSDALKTRKGWRLTVTNPSLTGYNGVLPYVYQDLEQELRLVRDDNDLHALLALFNHRTLMLTSMVATHSSLSVRYEYHHYRRDPLARSLLTLLGVPVPTSYLPADNLVRYSAILHRATTNLNLLNGILKGYFSTNIRLESPPIVRLPIAPDCLTRLRCCIGHKVRCVGILGRNAVVGHSCYLMHSGVNVVIQARNQDEYAAILSDHTLVPTILEMCNLYFSASARFRMQIECPRRCLSSPRLSAKPSCQTARLGLLSCLNPERHPDQMVIMDFPEVEYYTGQNRSVLPEGRL